MKSSAPLKVGLGCCVYSDPVGLNRLLDSTYLGVDRSIVVHTRYSHFPFEDPQSLAHTKAVCSRYSNIELIALNPTNQIKARTTYLRAAKDLDILIVLDSDEYIAADAEWDLFRDNLQKAILYSPGCRVFDLYTDGPIGQSGARPRIFYKPSTIYYYSHHYWFVIKETGRLLKGASDSAHLVKGITILHDKSFRTQEHFDGMIKYANWQMIGEH
jgi:hypothetical protein